MVTVRFLLLFLMTTAAAFAQDSALTRKKNVAVWEFQSSGDLKASQVKILTTRFQTSLVNTQVFDVLEREKMSEILKEQNFNLADACNSSECAVQVGQLLGVEFMIAGDIGLLGETYTIDLRMVDVTTGKIIKNIPENHEGKIDGLLLKLEKMASLLAGIEFKPAVTTATIEVISNPIGGEILFDGKKTGVVTPGKIDNVIPGKHNIEIRKEFSVGKQEITTVAGKTEKLMVVLSIPTVTVSFTSEPAGAEVMIDDKKIGTTPFQHTMKAGRYKLTMNKSGYETYGQMADIAEWSKSVTGSLKVKPISTQSKKKKSNTMWYLIGGAAVAGGAAVVLLGGKKSGSGGTGYDVLPVPSWPN